MARSKVSRSLFVRWVGMYGAEAAIEAAIAVGVSPTLVELWSSRGAGCGMGHPSTLGHEIHVPVVEMPTYTRGYSDER